MMRAKDAVNPLASAQWHRVAHLRPALPPMLGITRTWVRGQRWYVLHDGHRQRSCRLNDAAYNVAARLDGITTVEALWAQLDGACDLAANHDSDSHEPPSQDDVIKVLELLQAQGMLALDEALGLSPSETGATESATDGLPRQSLLAWRMPLGDPDAWLNARAHWARRLFSRAALIIWAALMLALMMGLAMHGQALRHHADTWMHTPRYLWLAVLAYPCIKALHEMGHALALKRWGGAVHEVGLTWMMFTPVPYVNASAAHSFAHAWQRAVVAAAGIACELALAAAGLWIWHWSEPGLIQDVAFVVWFTGCASTLLFNANPLQRLDGYHLLTEALHLPNLAMRSRQHWQVRMAMWLRGQKDPTHRPDLAPQAPGERGWLIAYAPLAWAYQLALWSGLCWWLGGISATLGWALAAASAWTLLIQPAISMGRLAWLALLESPRTAHGNSPQALRRALGAAGLALAVLLTPWPDRSLVQGVIWAPEEALIHSDVDGLVASVVVKDGQRVQTGDLLLTLHNPQLIARREHLAAKLRQADQGQYEHIGTDSAKAGQSGDEVSQLTAELARVEEQIAQLEVRARRHGRLVWPEGDDLLGRYARRGQLLGQVLDQSPPMVKVAVAQADVAPLQAHTAAISVRLRAPGSTPVSGTMLRDAVGATQQLPSPALSQEMGGDIITDPKDEHHLKTVRPVVLMDVQLDSAASPDKASRLGERAWVRLDHGWAPPIWQLWRWAQHRALTDFNPSR
jgi:putative peptide zinc metalloprotease protein